MTCVRIASCLLGRCAIGGFSCFYVRPPAGGAAGRPRPSSLVASSRDLVHRVADGEARRLGAWREFLEALQVLRDDGLSGHQQKGPMRVPVAVQHAAWAALERV